MSDETTPVGIYSVPGSLFAGSDYDPKGQYNVPAGKVNPRAAAIDALLANPWAHFADYQATVEAFQQIGLRPDGVYPASGHQGLDNGSLQTGAQKLRDYGFTLVDTDSSRPLGCYWWQGPVGIGNTAWRYA